MIVCGSLSKHPVSLGRAMHEAGYRALGLPWMYVPFRCGGVEDAIRGVRGLCLRGLGVSMPYKLEVVPLLDDLSAHARSIGAVNTIVNDEGRLTGHNTDADGAADALEEATPLDGRSVFLLGAGGAARAIAVGLAARGAKIVVCNRDLEKARTISALVSGEAVPWDARPRAAEHDVVVNGTSLGMSDVDPTSPLPASALRRGQVLLDAVYKPVETELVRLGRDAGLRVVRGERMLLHQAMGQFRLYTGREAPRDAMDAALADALR